MMGLLAGCLASLVATAVQVSFDPLEQRLARFLHLRSEAAGGAPPVLTHEQIAQELGSVPEVVTRVLDSLQAKGTVRLRRGWIEVADPTKLGALSGDPEVDLRRPGAGDGHRMDKEVIR